MQAGPVTLKSVFLIINRGGKIYQSLHFLLSKQLFLLPIHSSTVMVKEEQIIYFLVQAFIIGGL